MEKDIKLTKEQLQQIEAYLNNNDIEYIDLHLEVLDHISTAIENEMTIHNITFKEAFDNADKDFLKKVKNAHNSLTPNDLRLCAYLRLNLSSKENHYLNFEIYLLTFSSVTGSNLIPHLF